jgi:hypothetical protein
MQNINTDDLELDLPLVHTRTGFIYKPVFDQFLEHKMVKLWEKGDYMGQIRVTGGPYAGKVKSQRT